MWNNKKLLATLCCLFSLNSCTTSPTGRNQFIMVSGAEMATLGAQSFTSLKGQEKINQNAAINRYVQCVADALLAVTPSLPDVKSWEVVVFDSDQVNAFALPGGKIGVYTGLLKVAKTQDQLAAVIGHEIGHVMANHGGERVSNSMAANGAMQVANIALGQVNSGYNELIMAGLGVGMNVGILLPFSRTHESESDEIGLSLMHQAGFDSAQSVALWQNMAAASGKTPHELLSTHPAPATRIADLKQHISALPATTKKAPNCQRPAV